MTSYRLRTILVPTRGLGKAVLLLILGVILFTLGASLSFRQVIEPFLTGLADSAYTVLNVLFPNAEIDVYTHLLGGSLLLLGSYFLFQGLRAALRHLLETLDPTFRNAGMVDAYRRKQQLARGPKIVALGGGTGLSTLLRGLKQYSSNITAIVTVTDDGGSSGRLIQDVGMIPPGDIRNCLVALSDAEKSMADLFQHRFKDSGSLTGHSLGNLLLAALADQAGGNIDQAIATASEVLAIRGRVIPSTLNHVSLRAIMEDGKELQGETTIVAAREAIRQVFLDPAQCEPHPEAIQAIREADLICIGPGSVYTSVIPNLLVPGIADAIEKSRAKKVYICNVMTQPGESDSMTASEHVNSVTINVKARLFDYVLVNVGTPTPVALDRYERRGQHFVIPDIDKIRSIGYRPVTGDFMSETDVVRHDPMRIAAKLMSLIKR